MGYKGIKKATLGRWLKIIKVELAGTLKFNEALAHTSLYVFYTFM